MATAKSKFAVVRKFVADDGATVLMLAALLAVPVSVGREIAFQGVKAECVAVVLAIACLGIWIRCVCDYRARLLERFGRGEKLLASSEDSLSQFEHAPAENTGLTETAEWTLEEEVGFRAPSKLTGYVSQFQVVQPATGMTVLVFSEEYDLEVGFYNYLMRTFPEGKAAAVWFKRSGHAIPADVLRALRANDVASLNRTVQSVL